MEELVKRAKNGDDIAFNELIISLEKDLYKIAKMRLYCEEDINDAVQETLIQAYKYIKKLKHPEYFKTWIVKILINNCNTIYRKSNIERNIEYIEEKTKDYYLINNEDEIKNLDFYILIKNLKYKERITLTLYYLLEFTTKEISKILKEPENTIKTRISRAKIKLKKIYNGDNVYGRNRL